MNKLQGAIDVLSKAIEEHKPKAVFGLFSGGHDSLTATYVASQHPAFTAAVHINTGIGIEATRQFVRNTCEKNRWKLLEYKATENTDADGNPDPQNYEDLVLEHGFPGPFMHNKMYNRLKERQLRRLERDYAAKPNEPIMYVSGVRSQESIRRMRHTQVLQTEGRRIWVAPIHDFNKDDCGHVIKEAGLEFNPVVLHTGKSGECLCGAYAHEGELEELKFWSETRPAYDRLINLQKKVMAAGFPWGWEEQPPDWWKEKKAGQTFLLDYDNEAPEHLCWSCNKRQEKSND
jgi:3'-phosphoadenosine 5'-phosphosulfate sulfotransferase (PAPS reductase)/FAD synthetase